MTKARLKAALNPSATVNDANEIAKVVDDLFATRLTTKIDAYNRQEALIEKHKVEGNKLATGKAQLTRDVTASVMATAQYVTKEYGEDGYGKIMLKLFWAKLGAKKGSKGLLSSIFAVSIREAFGRIAKNKKVNPTSEKDFADYMKRQDVHSIRDIVSLDNPNKKSGAEPTGSKKVKKVTLSKNQREYKTTLTDYLSKGNVTLSKAVQNAITVIVEASPK